MANPNPSPETRFGAKNGNPINHSGKSSAQQKAEHKSSVIASELMLAALSSLQEKLESGEMPAEELISAEILRYIKEAQDRAHGTPKATSDVNMSGELILQTIIEK